MKTKKFAHKQCVNCRDTEKPAIEVVKMVKGKSEVSDLSYHKVIFITEGSIKQFSRDEPEYQAGKGKMLFLLAGSKWTYEATEESTIVLFRVQTPINLCRDLSLEELYIQVNKKRKEAYKPAHNNFGKLNIKPQIKLLVSSIRESINKGLNCHYWLEIKVKEFFLLLRVYYTKEEIYEFLYLILSNDIAFSEQIRLHWNKFQNVTELAAFLNLTTKRFNTRFNAVFGQTPYQWILQKRARMVLFEIKTTGKLFKEIAVENGFTSESSFTRFCRKEFDRTPTQIREEKLASKA